MWGGGGKGEGEREIERDYLFIFKRKGKYIQGKDQSQEVQRNGRKGGSEGLWKAHPCFLWLLEPGCLDLGLGIEVTGDAQRI